MKIHSEKGFTLVEVIMASLILVIGIGMIGSIIVNVTKKNFYSNRHTKAVVLANNKIDELLSVGYNSPLLAEGEYENPLNPVNATGDSSGIFYQFWVIEILIPISASKRIISEVQWDGADGEENVVTLTALCVEDID